MPGMRIGTAEGRVYRQSCRKGIHIWRWREAAKNARAERRQRAILYSWDTLMVAVNVGNALEMKGLNEYHGHAGYI